MYWKRASWASLQGLTCKHGIEPGYLTCQLQSSGLLWSNPHPKMQASATGQRQRQTLCVTLRLLSDLPRHWQCCGPVLLQAAWSARCEEVKNAPDAGLFWIPVVLLHKTLACILFRGCSTGRMPTSMWTVTMDKVRGILNSCACDGLTQLHSCCQHAGGMPAREALSSL